MQRTLWVGVCVGVLSSNALSASPLYETDVRPILKAHCFHCHGEEKTVEGNLDLRLRRFIVKGGDSGPALVPGDVDESLLLQRITSGEMPPGEDKKLSEKEVKIISDWIAANAPTARPEPDSLAGVYFTDEERNWWSFRPVSRPEVPKVQAPTANAIDAFILAKLAQELSDRGVTQLSPTADKETLIRRVYLDMLGLPPSPKDVDEFVNDESPGAWARLVERVLASPAYGEQWARYWLDVAGYADSEGYTDEDRVRENAWRYRDYVIQSFNVDKPYDLFLTEQLAGDELVGWPNGELRPEMIGPLAATGFLRMAPDGTDSGGIDQAVARNQVIADTMQIVGTSVLGMTVHCAQCHDHRYDPIPQRDYYAMRAIFEPALDWKNWKAPSKRLVSLYSEADRQKRAEIEKRAQQVDAERAEKANFYIAKTLEHELLMVAEELREPLRTAFRTPAAKRTAEQKQLLDDHPNIARITQGSLYLYDRRRDARAKDLDDRRAAKLAAYLKETREQGLSRLDESQRKLLTEALALKPEERSQQQKELIEAHPEVAVTEATLAEFNPQAAADLKAYADAAAEIRSYRIQNELQEFLDKAQKIREEIPKEHFLRILSEEPGKTPATHVFYRGDHQQPKEQVAPSGLSVLGSPEFPTGGDGLKTSGRRLRFAKYLTSGEHPLVARVFVNRIWAHHFGRGLVGTTGDFGRLGDQPTHPELLDWLAAEFVASGWKVKHLHRLVLTSLVYQQSAVGSPELVEADPQNRLLGRWPMRRLTSEALRDTILQTVGKLNAEMYGPPVPVMEDEVGQIVLGKENLDGERKPTKPIPLGDQEFRRSIYIQVRRSRPLGMLENFDLPDLAPNCTERPSSNVAPQALMMMNSDFIHQTSEAMAQRLLAEHPNATAEQLREGWRLAFCRRPSDAELTHAQQFLEQQTQAFAANNKETDAHRLALTTYCQALMGSNRFLYIE